MSSNDLSYEDLELDFAQFNKRQRLDDDFFFGQPNKKQPELLRILSSTSVAENLPDSMKDYHLKENEISIDDMLLERQSP